MTYAYFNRLSKAQQKIYRASDKIKSVKLDNLSSLKQNATQVEQSLASASVELVEQSSQILVDRICEQLTFATACIHVLERRPHNNYGELHGLYEPIDGHRKRGHIYVWMRTAKRQQVVAYKTYLRTLVHELCHHLDYEYFRLADSYHTQGFFQRESSIVKQLIS